MIISWLAHCMISQTEVETITWVSVLGLITIDSEWNNIYSKCALLILIFSIVSKYQFALNIYNDNECMQLVSNSEFVDWKSIVL